MEPAAPPGTPAPAPAHGGHGSWRGLGIAAAIVAAWLALTQVLLPRLGCST